MFFGSRKQQVSSGLGIVGIIAILFGIIWIVATFGSFLKAPIDLDRTIELSGEYIVTDQTFLVELRGYATITALWPLAAVHSSPLPQPSKSSRAQRSAASSPTPAPCHSSAILRSSPPSWPIQPSAPSPAPSSRIPPSQDSSPTPPP